AAKLMSRQQPLHLVDRTLLHPAEGELDVAKAGVGVGGADVLQRRVRRADRVDGNLVGTHFVLASKSMYCFAIRKSSSASAAWQSEVVSPRTVAMNCSAWRRMAWTGGSVGEYVRGSAMSSPLSSNTVARPA